ncbi:MAG: hypothetical protein ACFFCS_26710 [Candidatus Hodarchaeota archaeon]
MVSQTFAIQFDVEEDGTCIQIPWSPDNFTDDKIILVLEEWNQLVWLYYGSKNGLVKKRKALRQAESLRGHGYTVGKTIIGRHLTAIKEIDGRKIERVPETKADYEKLLSIYEKPFRIVDGECVALGESGFDVAPAPAPAPAAVPAPAPAPAPTATKLFETSTETKLQKSDSMEKSDEIKAGNLIMAILRDFSDVYISKKGNHLKIESLDGAICELTITDGKIKFSSDSFKELDPELKKKIQAGFVELSM